MTQHGGGYQIERFPYPGAVDCDGHVIEPANLWEEYLEAKWKPRAIRLRKDELGLEYLEVDGKPHNSLILGAPGLVARIATDLSEMTPSPEKTYGSQLPYGASDPAQRLDLLDKENLEAAVLYATLGLVWESHCTDAELAQAYTRAYNRWIAEFCRNSRGRLVPIAHLSLMDPPAAAKELERAVKDGCRGAFVTPRTHLQPESHGHRPLGHSAHDPVFATAERLDVPISIHVGNPFPWDANWFPNLKADVGALEPANREFDPRSPAAYFFDFNSIGIMHGTQRAFVSLFSHGTLEQFPGLRVAVLEAQAGWIGSFLDRLDSVWEHVCPAPGRGIPLKDKPSHYFRRQCFISADPDEISTAKIMEYVGDDRFMWASDYPHYDHPESWVPELQKLVDPLPAATRARVLGANARSFYRL